MLSVIIIIQDITFFIPTKFKNIYEINRGNNRYTKSWRKQSTTDFLMKLKLMKIQENLKKSN